MDNNSGWGSLIFTCLMIWGAISLFGGRSKIDDCRKLIEIANDRIDEMNSQIEYVRTHRWQDEDYESLSEDIDNLTTQGIVSNYSDADKNKCLKS